MIKNLHKDIYIGLIMLILSLLGYLEANNLNRDAGIFPTGLLVIFAIFGLIIIVTGVVLTYKSTQVEGDNERNKWDTSYIGVMTMIIYSFLISKIGFFVSSALFILIILKILGSKNWKHYLFVPTVLLFFIYFLFKVQLGVRLPTGILF